MKTINAKDAHEALQNNNAILIDVREQEEFDEVRIEGAIHCPLSDLPNAIQNVNFEKTEDKKIIFQCLKGGRSAQAINFLPENILKDFEPYNLDGGILAWIENDLPVTK
jgi:rhodanese-related sulfurtransferase